MPMPLYSMKESAYVHESCIFSSPELKAQGELIVWDSSRRPSVRPSVRATDMDLGAFLVVWR